MLNDMDDEDDIDEDFAATSDVHAHPGINQKKMQKRRYHLKNSLRFAVTPESGIKRLEFLEEH